MSHLPHRVVGIISNAFSLSYHVFFRFKLCNLLHRHTTQIGTSRVIYLSSIVIVACGCIWCIVQRYSTFIRYKATCITKWYSHQRQQSVSLTKPMDMNHSNSISTTRRNNSFTRRIVWLTSSNAQSMLITTCWVFCELGDAMNLSDWQQYCNILQPRLRWIGYMDSSEDAV